MKSVSGRSQFGANVLRLEDEERQRIARELHSTTAQRLAALQLNLALVARSADALEPRARAALNDSVELVRTCAREIRAVSYRLHPPLLDEFGLTAALRAFTEEFTRRTGAVIDLEVPEAFGRLAHETEVGLFRVVQNLVSHLAPGVPTRIRLARERSKAMLEVESARPVNEPDRAVLAAVRERAQHLRGRVAVKSSGGFRMTLAVPLRRRLKAG